MTSKKKPTSKRKRQNRLYTYDEYKKAFYPKAPPSSEPQRPEIFGGRLAEEALKQLKQEAPRQ